MWVITPLSGRSAAPFDLQVQPSFGVEWAPLEPWCPRICSAAWQEQGSTHVSSISCVLGVPAPSSPQRDENLVGSDSPGLSPEHGEGFSVAVLLQGTNSSSGMLRQCHPSPCACWICSPGSHAPPMGCSQHKPWSLHTLAPVESARFYFQRRCNWVMKGFFQRWCSVPS